MVFAQQLYGYAKKGDVFLGITTSGNSKMCFMQQLQQKH